MAHKANERCFTKVSEVFSGALNDVAVYLDRSSEGSDYYYLWKIKEHHMVKQLLALQDQLPDKGCFYGDDGLCFIFPYKVPRPLSKFYQESEWSKEERRGLYRQIVALCLREELPYPLLYLILKEQELHLMSDRRIYFSYCLDLGKLDMNREEQDCVLECTRILLTLMRKTEKEDELYFKLIKKKAKRKAYSSFIQLYRDISISEQKRMKAGFKIKLSQIDGEKRDTIFRILLILVMVLLVVSVIILISQIVFGEIPLFRLFENCFKRIGTESLL